MQIAIIGTGKMAENLAKGWLKAGHEVALGSRDPAAHRQLAESLGPKASVVTHDEAVRLSSVVLLALPYAACAGFVEARAADLAGKVVVDMTNPFNVTPPDNLAGAEVTQRAIGHGVHIVAAFKTNYASALTNPVDAAGTQRDVFYCGNDEASKGAVRALITDLGLRPVDCGPLSAARALDLMVPLMIEMDRRLGGKGLARRAHWKFATP